MKKLKCPNCRVAEMDRIEVDQIEVDQCPKCEGVWFDNFEPELPDILAKGRDKLPEQLKKSLTVESGKLETTKSRDRVCPRCSQPMLTYWYAGKIDRTFQVDGCMNGCGVWFDDGELGKAFEYLTESVKDAGAVSPDGIIGKVHVLKESRKE